MHERAVAAREAARLRGRHTGRPPRLAAAQARQVRLLRAGGESISELVRTFGVSRATAYRALNAVSDDEVPADPVPTGTQGKAAADSGAEGADPRAGECGQRRSEARPGREPVGDRAAHARGAGGRRSGGRLSARWLRTPRQHRAGGSGHHRGWKGICPLPAAGCCPAEVRLPGASTPFTWAAPR